MPLLLIRHAQSEGPAPHMGLTPEGERAALALAGPLKKLGVDAVYASPYVRAVSTVAPLAAVLGAQIGIVADVRERDVRFFDAQEDFFAHVRRGIEDPSFKLEDEESFAEVAARALPAIDAVARAGHALPAIATHGQALTAVLRSCDPRFGFAQWRALKMPHVILADWRGGKLVSFRDIDLS